MFVAATAVSGVRAIVFDYRVAFRDAWSTALPPRIADEIATVRMVMREDKALLLIYAGDSPWLSELWQAALYPTEVIVLPNAWVSPTGIAQLRSRFGIRYAVSIGSPPLDPGFARVRDIGPALELGERTWFGRLR